MTFDDQTRGANNSEQRGPADPNVQSGTTLGGVWRPTLVIVSGPPGSGKTTLARQLAQALGCPLLSRDEINEGIFHTFNHDLSIADKDGVAKLTFDVFFRTIELLLSSRVSIVAEAAFQDYRWRIGLNQLGNAPDTRVIHCEVDPDVARQRLLHRRLREPDTSGMRRAARVRLVNKPDLPAASGFQALSLPVPALRVATTDGYEPGFDEIVEFVRADRYR
jgi:predicted kinase